VDHASDHVLRRQRTGDRAAGIDALEARPRVRTGRIVEEPPGNAVHRGQHDSVLPDERSDRAGGLRQRGALDGDDDEILRAEIAARSDTRAGARVSASPWRNRQPCSRNAASVAPRAIALTSDRPAAASRVPIKPPMAPAPTMQTFILIRPRFPSITAREGDEFATASGSPARNARRDEFLRLVRAGGHTTSLADEAPSPFQVGIPLNRPRQTPSMQRKLTVILSADVVGYSALMERDEAGTLDRLKLNRSTIFDPRVAAHGGRIVKLMGDGALVEFGSVVSAVDCAREIQQATEGETGTPEPERIRYRIGINLGEVIVEGDDIYGDGVNVAARLQALAEPGGVALSRTVRDQVAGKLACDFDDLGEHTVKNITRPVHVFAVRALPAEGAAAARRRRDSACRSACCLSPT
jgi:class 3 adenylate cyclase